MDDLRKTRPFEFGELPGWRQVTELPLLRPERNELLTVEVDSLSWYTQSESRPMRTVYTIGYEGTDIGRFIQTLLSAGIEVLADVRAVAISRKRGFSKRALAEHLWQAGIRYVHFKDLGDPKPGRVAARAGQYLAFRRIYTRHLASQPATDAIQELAALASAEVTCLMCFERDPVVCHRSIVADQLRTITKIKHLCADSHGETAVIPRRRTREGATAAEQALR